MSAPETVTPIAAHRAWRYYCSHARDARQVHLLGERSFQRLYSGAMMPGFALARAAAARMAGWLERNERPNANPDKLRRAVADLRAWADDRERQRAASIAARGATRHG